MVQRESETIYALCTQGDYELLGDAGAYGGQEVLREEADVPQGLESQDCTPSLRAFENHGKVLGGRVAKSD